MSTVVVGGGGPRPQARIVELVDVTEPNAGSTVGNKWAVFDGAECVATFGRLSHAKALLPLIQSGE